MKINVLHYLAMVVRVVSVIPQGHGFAILQSKFVKSGTGGDCRVGGTI
jgi:hypothetical protein